MTGKLRNSSVNGPRILVLNCDLDQDKSTNGANLVQSALRDRFVDVVDVFRQPMGEIPGSYNGLVITGSVASIYEDVKWISDFVRTVQEIDRSSIPTLGICFGFQAVGQALGGSVTKSGRFEEGYKAIALTEEGRNDPIFTGMRRELMVYESHGDVVERLPAGASVLAKNDFSVQGYRLREFTCVQFHPEITPSVAQRMAVRDGKPVEEIMNGVDRSYSEPERVLQNFVNNLQRVAENPSGQ